MRKQALHTCDQLLSLLPAGAACCPRAGKESGCGSDPALLFKSPVTFSLNLHILVSKTQTQVVPKALAQCWTNFIMTAVMLIRMTIIMRLKHFVILSVCGPAARELGPNLTIWQTSFLPDCGFVSPLVALLKAGVTNPTTCH